MFDKGAIDINDPAVRQKVYELFGETGMMQTFNKDATNARLENQEFKNGAKEIRVMPEIEDLGVHLYFHKDQAKSQDFRKWPSPAQQALIQHIMETLQAMQPPPMPPGAHPPQPGQPMAPNNPKTIQGQNPQLAAPTPVAGAM
jgi:hypothetical protein